MTCHELIDQLLEYLDGDLVEEQHTQATVHLDGCENCRFYLESYTHTTRVVRNLRCRPLPTSVEEKLRAVLGEHLRDPQ